ncbi:MAG: alanine--tRNA ligase, partial [Lentisphaeria bacterium]
MEARELRLKFLNFFKERNHTIIDSASVVPDNDPTCLFTTAGMHPLVPYLLGESHPGGRRLVDVQKCIRTGDIDEVGDDVHLTFFEMLGNWSLGDYFKKEIINWSYEFLTSKDYLALPIDRLAVSVFAGDNDAPFDEEAYSIWKSLGICEERIARLGKKDNWWGPAGQTGPCGPDTEMFYWVGELPAPVVFDATDRRWVEIWNDVFMEYNKTIDGKYEPLAQKNVDTGMGLERVTAIINGYKSAYETPIFTPLFDKLAELSAEQVDCYNKSARIVVEHLRAATFILADGVMPGNVDQGYVLRRLIRRAINEGRKLGIDDVFTVKIAEVVIDEYGDFYKELTQNSAFIIEELEREEQQFKVTLEKGLREFNKMIASIPAHIQRKVIAGRKAFNLYETFGFPL